MSRYWREHPEEAAERAGDESMHDWITSRDAALAAMAQQQAEEEEDEEIRNSRLLREDDDLNGGATDYLFDDDLSRDGDWCDRESEAERNA